MQPFEKPSHWNTLAFFEKITVYCNHLGEQHAPYVDKLNAKDIIKAKCGDAVSTSKVVRVLKDCNDLRQEDLNQNHIIKTTHGSGWNINITNDTKLNDCLAMLRKWNVKLHQHPEKQYRYIEPRFFIEEKIDDIFFGITGAAVVFMIRCIHGSPMSIGVKHDGKQNIYDTNWVLLMPACLPFELDRPKQLEEMLLVASILSAEFEFVRIDLYLGRDEKIYFSEFTFTPKAGKRVLPYELEMELGASWV